MALHRRQTRGFTLIELMIVVGIIGILSAIAIPSLATFIKRSKASEVPGNLNALFQCAAAYYNGERTAKSLASTTNATCTVATSPFVPATPSGIKQEFTGSTSFNALGFGVADYVYFSYRIVSGGEACNNPANNTAVYTMQANGDLDGDTEMSTFELAVGSNASNELYHAPGFHIVNENE